jgi:hypothetical protein
MSSSYAFWYVYSSNGTDGFLLDLIRRPEAAMARLAVFHEGCPPRILRRGFATADLHGTPGELGVRMGDFCLDALGCAGTIDDVSLEAQYALDGRHMRFVPSWITSVVPNIPNFRSNYGKLQSASCAGAAYGEGPVVCSTYTVDDVASAKWVLISAPQFPGTDLAFEISAANLLGRWQPTAWLYYGGSEHQLNKEFDALLHVRVDAAGDVQGSERIFRASIHDGDLRVKIEGRATVDQFARLDAEGQTEIHTTLFGTCRATVNHQTFTAERTCLLELKS